jgi:uncharacterized protein
MQIAVVSDIHDNIWALADVLPRLAGCDVLLCLGDLCSPFTLTAIGEGFRGPVHIVWGNNDGDKLLMSQNAAKLPNIALQGEFAELQLGGRSVAITHYPHIANALAAGGLYDLVCHGHNHQRKASRLGKTLLVNPGEIMGRFGVHSYAVYDTIAGDAQILEL